MQTKEELRTYYKQIERSYKGSDFTKEDHASCQALLSSQIYQQAQWLFAFFPLPSEVDIKTVLIDAIQHKHLALPVCEADNTLTFYEVTDLQAIQEGSFGIKEPQRINAVIPSPSDLVLVPAVAYSLAKERLGRGKGFYDRFLSTYQIQHTLGICRLHQIQENIPTDRWDLTVSQLLCNGIFY